MNDNEVRWGVIGAGDVVEHKSGMPLNTVSGSRWIALMRRNQETARKIADRFKVPLVYEDADRLLENDEINAVYIATPPSSHARLAINALEAGKNVYLEKPMAMNVSEAQKIAAAVGKSGKKLVVAHYRRAVPAFVKVKELIDSGAVGKVLFVGIRMLQPDDSTLIAGTELPWRLDPSVSGGGLFHDLSPHQLDLCLHWFGNLSSGSGTSRNLRKTNSADDYVAGHLRFESGVELNGLWCFGIDSSAHAVDRCEIFGTSGRLRFSFFGESIEIELDAGSKAFTFTKPEWIQEPMIARTVRYFLGEGENPCPAEDGVETMRMIEVLCGDCSRN